jgi:hypothetical protein
MKITVKKSVTEAIELPQFFKVGTQSFKISNNQEWFTRIGACTEAHPELHIFPKITIETIYCINTWVDREEIIPISSDIFHADLLKVVTEIEKLTEV